MRIINQMPEKAEVQIWFHNDPLVEMVASLHVLASPEHHEHCQRWAENTWQALDEGLKEDIAFFSDNYSQWLLIMDIVTGIACDCWEEERENELDIDSRITRFRQLPIEKFANLFLGLPALHIEQSILKAWLERPRQIADAQLRPLLPYMSKVNIVGFLENASEYQSRLADIFQIYWKEAFEDNWGSISIHIDRIAGQQRIVAEELGSMEYVTGLHESVAIINNKLVVKKEVEYEMELADIKQVHIFPSVFSAPHFMMDIRNTDLIVYYNLDFYSVSMEDAVPAEVLERMKALSDENRLKILKIIWGESATTKRLSEILNLAPSTVSVHLKLLKKVGLVRGRQVKKFVYYEANQEALSECWQQMMRFLERKF